MNLINNTIKIDMNVLRINEIIEEELPQSLRLFIKYISRIDFEKDESFCDNTLLSILLDRDISSTIIEAKRIISISIDEIDRDDFVNISSIIMHLEYMFNHEWGEFKTREESKEFIEGLNCNLEGLINYN
ncbi:hypothetical protein [Flammeovirga pacifica]|uniref:Uncharacterized protein n=1 Tax=Flammeovirga pacifica TaxID=915059 RepID=A0A1S1Z256_FLAPC|nr:hypothetical protein [Flammeovirga pacifica]OHX67359.1 hypothetical protein NH26_13910 [Flammeovirga pacifica]